MDDIEKSYIGLHVALIKKTLNDYKNRNITDNEFLAAIQNHTDLILEVTLNKAC